MEAVIRSICAAGSASHRFFGGTWTGGYYLQQNPAELAQLMRTLRQSGPFADSLEIGIAAGGTTRLIREHVSIGATTVIDDGTHPHHIHWQRNRVGIERLVEFIGDSHSPQAKRFLTAAGRSYDYVAIDGDHSDEGVLQDWQLVQPLLAERAVVWFHDIHLRRPGGDGVRRLWHEELREKHEVLLETRELSGIGVIRVERAVCNQAFSGQADP